MRLLMVSESARVRRRAMAALRANEGVRIEEALSAAGAHERALDGDYDVLVIDGDMRPEGGFSVLYELRAHGQLHGVAVPPAIILLGREDDRWLARWAGAAEAYVKPVEAFDLAERIRFLAGRPGAGEVPTTAGETVGRELAMDDVEPSRGRSDPRGSGDHVPGSGRRDRT